MRVPAIFANDVNYQLLRLSIPLAGVQLANIALAATDTVMMGHLGLGALAGGGLAVIWFNQIRTVAVGFLTPLGNRIALAHAQFEGVQKQGLGLEAKRAECELRNEIRNLTRVGLLLAILSGIVGAAILIAIGYALPLLGQSDEITSSAISMMWMLAPGLIPCLWFQVSRQFCVGLGKPQALLGITLAMIVVNAVLNFVLGFGFGPLRALGVVGIGLATSLVHLVSAVAYLRLIVCNSELATFHALDFWRADDGITANRLGCLFKTQLRLGLPVAVTYGAEAGMFSVLAMIMGSIGAVALAAHNIVYQVTFIVFQIGVGFSHGSSILVSRAWALGNQDLARRIGARAQEMVTAVVAVFAIVFLVFPQTVLKPFIGNGDWVSNESGFANGTTSSGSGSTMLALTIGLLAIGALMEFVDTAQNVAIGVLRGIGDTTTGLIASLIGYWAIGLPAALVFAFPLNLGAYGIWWGLVVGLATSAAILWCVFFAKTRPKEVSELKWR